MNRYPPKRFAAPGGAFMRYGEHTAEFKRMWTDTDHRRQGLAQKVLVELEGQAAALG